MTEGRFSGEENANLYTRGSNEARAGEVLDGGALLEILDVFGEDGVRSYSSDTWKASSTSWRTSRAHSPKNKNELLSWRVAVRLQ